MKAEIENLDAAGLRKFGFVTGLIVIILFGVFLPFLLDHGWPIWPWYIAVPLWLLAAIYPPALNPVYRGWMRFGLVLGWINTRIILSFIFYVMFTPVSLILKILRKDPMRRKKEPDSASYRIETTNHPREHMERPY